MDLISIIIPVYNVEKYISECLDSVLSQTYSNIEVIAIDDGSTDQSGAICDHYAAKDSRVLVIHKENEGVSAARNEGLKHVSREAKYIGFVDSDDVVSEKFYSNLMAALLANQADMAITGFARINDNNDILEIPTEGVICNSVFSIEEIVNSSVKSGGWCYRLLWNKLYRKDLFDGITFPEHKVHEDEAVSFRLFLRCKKIVCTDSAEYYYRCSNTHSIMANKNKKINDDLMDALLYNTRLMAHHKYNYAANNMMQRVALEYGSLCKKHFAGRKECYEKYRKTLKYLSKKKVLDTKTAAACTFIKLFPVLGYNLINFAKNARSGSGLNLLSKLLNR